MFTSRHPDAQKIYHWYLNHSPNKKHKDEEKFNLGRVFTGERVWGLKNRAAIKAQLPDIDSKSKEYVATWNRTRRTIWDGMSEAEQEPWNELADRWTEEGPEDEVKAEYVHPIFPCAVTHAPEEWHVRMRYAA